MTGRYQHAWERHLGVSRSAAARTEPAGSWHLARVLVGDVMTRAVVTVTARTPVKAMVGMLARYQVSALPVVDPQRRIIGIVAESDLLTKLAATPDPSTRVLRWRNPHADLSHAIEAETAADLMVASPRTTRADDTVVLAARRMARLGLRRLPVVNAAGVLVGMLTHADLLRVYLRSDADISRHLSQAIVRERFGIPPGSLDVQVDNGVVTLFGCVERHASIDDLVAAVHGITGVVAVRHHLTCRTGDTARAPAPIPPPDHAAQASPHRSLSASQESVTQQRHDAARR